MDYSVYSIAINHKNDIFIRCENGRWIPLDESRDGYSDEEVLYWGFKIVGGPL